MGGLFGSSNVYNDRVQPPNGGRGGAEPSTMNTHFESMTMNPDVRPGGGGAAHPGGSTVRRTLSIPKEFPGLLELSSSELSSLLTDPGAFARFLHGTEGAREARAFTRDLRGEIAGMCRVNVEMAEEAGDLRSQMQVIRSCDMQPVKEGYDAVKARADALLARYNLAAVLGGLKERAAGLDTASEELSEEMVQGKVPVDVFVERYRKMREEYHRDAVKAGLYKLSAVQLTHSA